MKDGKSDRPATVADATSASLRDNALTLIAFATVLGLLYVGRDVLIPITVALMLSLLIAPLVRRLRRTGIGQTPAVLAVVLVLTLVLAAMASVLGLQVLRMGAALPKYEATIHQKLDYLNDMTLGRLEAVTNEAGRLVDSHSPARAAATRPGEMPTDTAPLPVEVFPTHSSPLQVVTRIISSVWQPVASTGIVLVVLVFVLLEHEALRDRFIRAVGGSNIRLTTVALNDAGERLSRFFASQLAVNLGVGLTIGLGLTFLGLPQAFLWGALATLLRFVPYIGVWIAALLATGLAFAVVPGWSLALGTLGLFALVEFIAGQALEPTLYGHTTGLSPLSVVIAAIFWSALWGPVGLVLSTPLTLCLLVLGRHIRALSFLDLLLGDSQALTLAQRFYQRALSGDADEILSVARTFLKRNSLAAYCDLVLMPALHLASLDREMGVISTDQQSRMRDTLVAVVSTLTNEPNRLRRRQSTILDEQNPGLILRNHREQLLGRWQGPLAVPPGSILLCIGLGARADIIAAELLVRVFREQNLDARHLLTEDLEPSKRPAEGDPAAIGAVFLVSAFPNEEREASGRIIGEIRQRFPGGPIVAVFLPGVLLPADIPLPVNIADRSASSFAVAEQLCLGKPLVVSS